MSQESHVSRDTQADLDRLHDHFERLAALRRCEDGCNGCDDCTDYAADDLCHNWRDEDDNESEDRDRAEAHAGNG